MFFLDSIWLIPLFPLFGAAVMLLLGRRFDPQRAAGHDDHGHGHHAPPPGRKIISLLCPGMVLLSFVFSLGAVVELQGVPNHTHEVIKFTWLAGLPSLTSGGAAPAFTADWGFLLDPISAVMILVVTGVGFLIHVYSIGYMAMMGATTASSAS
jgi:NADH-quinone oxidoreductase subunit L